MIGRISGQQVEGFIGSMKLYLGYELLAYPYLMGLKKISKFFRQLLFVTLRTQLVF